MECRGQHMFWHPEVAVNVSHDVALHRSASRLPYMTQVTHMTQSTRLSDANDDDAKSVVVSIDVCRRWSRRSSARGVRMCFAKSIKGDILSASRQSDDATLAADHCQ